MPRAFSSKYCLIMAYDSAWSTPEGTPPRIHVVESSPSIYGNASKVYNNLRTNVLPKVLPREASGFGCKWNILHRVRLRSLSRVIGLTVLMVALLWWWLNIGNRTIQFRYDVDSHSPQLNLDGLQFIDAGHPYIRVRNSLSYSLPSR
jgi:hypothetical protein